MIKELHIYITDIDIRISAYPKMFSSVLATLTAISVTSIVFIGNIKTAEGRIHRMHKSHNSYCDYDYAKKVDRENEKLKEYKAYLESNNDELVKIITINNCKEGYMFVNHKTPKYGIECIACPENHYRGLDNSTCFHCPEGYYSDIGATECKKAKTNSSNVHTLCNKGSIIGSNKFGLHKESCIKCLSLNNKYYMPYDNNHDSCMTCPAGSIVLYGGTHCAECPMGYYEKDNECIKCNIGTYADKSGMAQCKVCSNKNSLAYVSVGGYNCDNSIFHDLAETINSNVMNMDIILKPLVFGAHSSAAFIANYNKELVRSVPALVTLSVFASIWLNA